MSVSLFFQNQMAIGEGKKIISRFPLYTNKSTLNAFLIYDQIIIFVKNFNFINISMTWEAGYYNVEFIYI